MPHWDVTVANVYDIRLEAETEDEAVTRAKASIAGERGHEQQVLKLEKLEEG